MAHTENEKKYLNLVQVVRVLDVVFIGPIMIYSGTKIKGAAGNIMIFLGVATIIFNGYNFYLHNKK